MQKTTYPLRVGQIQRPDPLKHLAEGDRWVSLRSLRNQPHVSAGLDAAPAPADPAVPNGAERSIGYSLYMSVKKRHEQARRSLQTDAVPAPVPLETEPTKTGDAGDDE